MRRLAMRTCVFALCAAMAVISTASEAGIPGRSGRPSDATIERAITDIQRALDEQRLLDAGRLLDDAILGGVTDPRLTLLGGELDLLHNRFEDALSEFRDAEKSTTTQPRALQDEGVVLSLLGRSDQALDVLQKAVAMNPKAWRAWNALGAEYDARSQWAQADAAYDHAITSSGGAAMTLNNRGYSRLLQHRRDEAITDLVAALHKKPDLAEARTNLRLALALGGDYDRALAGGSSIDQAAFLNNAGFAAAMRGDFVSAKDLLNRAIKLKSEYYDRASENLKIVQALAAENPASAHVAP